MPTNCSPASDRQTGICRKNIEQPLALLTGICRRVSVARIPSDGMAQPLALLTFPLESLRPSFEIESRFNASSCKPFKAPNGPRIVTAMGAITPRHIHRRA